MTDVGGQSFSTIKPRLPLGVLVAIMGLQLISVNIYSPAVPAMAEAFGTDAATINLSLSLYLVGLALGQVAYGVFSDRFGRRPVLIVGVVVYCLGSIICALAPAVAVFHAGRALQALGACSGLVLGRAMVRDTYEHGRAAALLGYTVMITSIASGLAPAAAGLLVVSHGWRAPFWLTLAVGVGVLGVCIALAPETTSARASGPTRLFPGAGAILRRRRFWRFASFSALSFTCYFVFVAGSPAVAIGSWGSSPTEFGAWWMIASFSYLAGNYVAGRLSERLGVERMMRIGIPVILWGGLLLMALVVFGPRHPLSLFIPIGVIFFGSGVTEPNAIANAAGVEALNVGTVYGLLGFLQIVAGIVGVTLLGMAPEANPVCFAAICCGALGLAALLNWILK